MRALVSALAAAALAATAAAATGDGGPIHDAKAALTDLEGAFARWAAHHAKPYVNDVAEMSKRRGIFHNNALFVQQHNGGEAGTTLALNQFADLTFEEFRGAYLGYDPSLAAGRGGGNAARLQGFRHKHSDPPESKDWQADGAVTPVKNQGQCGSCWAFSTTGSIEGINYLQTGDLVALSEQELVDCDRSHDNGCGGGLMDFAFEYVVKNGGLDSETDYAYWGAFPSFCNHRKQTDRHVVDITGFEDVPANDEGALQRAVAAQPVSVAICVGPALQLYSSGVFGGECCTGLNHGVLVTGYGVEEDSNDEKGEGQAFWRVKNSWGTGWGEQGYFRLQRASGAGDSSGPGQCGIAMKASYPVKADHDDPTVPHICDAHLFSLWECPADRKCRCDFNFLGLFCFAYSCIDPNA